MEAGWTLLQCLLYFKGDEQNFSHSPPAYIKLAPLGIPSSFFTTTIQALHHACSPLQPFAHSVQAEEASQTASQTQAQASALFPTFCSLPCPFPSLLPLS